MLDNYNTDSLTEGNEQTLNDIKQLQTEEMNIYNKLNKTKLTTEQKQRAIDQMNQISQMRINLYSNLKNMNSSYNQNVRTSRNTLDEQLVAIDIIEDELNNAKRRLKLLEIDKYNKLRMVEINTYYSKKYDAYASLMKTIVYFCIPVLILVFLGNLGIIPSNINGFIIGIIMIIGIFLLGYKILDLITRDNMNFDEYNWYFDKSKAPVDNTGASNPINPWGLPSIICMGEQCCAPNATYDSSLNVCVANVSS